MPHASLISVASWLPERRLTNADLETMVDTSDEWIRSRTGIAERRIAAEGEATSDLAARAGSLALERARVAPSDVDLLVVATSTPDHVFPSCACLAQVKMGLTCPAFDVNAACSGFVYALSVAHGLLAIGAERLLVIGAETLSRITDWDERGVAVLVGDGAGAVVLEAVDGPGQLLSWVLGADGSLRHLLKCDHGGYLYMDGKEIFRKAVRVVVDSAEQAIAEAGLTVDDIDLIVPHQANLRIITAACQRLGIPEEKAVVVIDRYGNTSSASIPLALVDALDTGRIEKGDHVLLTGFGGGMTWASAVLRWGG